MNGLAASLKARDGEENAGRLFYRPLGYVSARLAHFFGLTPNAVTVGSLMAGLLAAYSSIADWHWGRGRDGAAGVVRNTRLADGQLARLTSATHAWAGYSTAGEQSDLRRALSGLVFRLADGRPWLVAALVLARPRFGRLPFVAVRFPDFLRMPTSSSGMVRTKRALLCGALADSSEQGWSARAWPRAVHLYVTYRASRHGWRATTLSSASGCGATVPARPCATFRTPTADSPPALKYHNILTATRAYGLRLRGRAVRQPLLFLLFEIFRPNGLLSYASGAGRQCAPDRAAAVRTSEAVSPAA